MAGKRNILKLQTNIPIVGRIEKAYFAESKREDWANQIALDGTWDGDSNARVYGSMWVADKLASLGIIEITEHDGEPRYRVMDTQSEVELLKKEDGTKKRIEVRIAGGGDVPVHDKDYPPDALRGQVSPVSRPEQIAQTTATVAPSRTRPNYWKAQALTMERCLKAAAWALGYRTDDGEADLETAMRGLMVAGIGSTDPPTHIAGLPEQTQHIAVSMYIQANRDEELVSE